MTYGRARWFWPMRDPVYTARPRTRGRVSHFLTKLSPPPHKHAHSHHEDSTTFDNLWLRLRLEEEGSLSLCWLLPQSREDRVKPAWLLYSVLLLGGYAFVKDDGLKWRRYTNIDDGTILRSERANVVFSTSMSNLISDLAFSYFHRYLKKVKFIGIFQQL